MKAHGPYPVVVSIPVARKMKPSASPPRIPDTKPSSNGTSSGRLSHDGQDSVSTLNAGNTERDGEVMTYEDGQGVNGHQFNAATNSWDLLRATPPAPRGSVPGPCSHCGGMSPLRRLPRVIDWLGGVLMLSGYVLVAQLTNNAAYRTFGIPGSALLGAAIGVAVAYPIVARRRYRCVE
jgi:hypothetical protein